LIEALEDNFTQRFLSCDWTAGHDFQWYYRARNDGEFEAPRVDVLLERNKRLSAWVMNPASVQLVEVPFALKLAANASEWSLFQALLLPLIKEQKELSSIAPLVGATGVRPAGSTRPSQLDDRIPLSSPGKRRKTAT